MSVELDKSRPFTGESKVGQVFKRLTVIEYAGRRVYRHGKASHYWTCLCLCGNSSTVCAGNLTTGRQVSCGCWKDENTVKRNTIHEHSDHPMYAVWGAMIQRCENPRDKGYKNYGARGITVCKQWETFSNFWNDMSETWRHGLWIERNDNNGNYTPENCFWAIPLAQSRNTRRNTYVTFQGETKTVTEWSDKIGANRGLVSYRMLHGWTPEQAVTTVPPIRKAGSS